MRKMKRRRGSWAEIVDFSREDAETRVGATPYLYIYDNFFFVT